MTPTTPAPLLPDRSYLFVPGDRPERFDKAIASRADAVILDLEDAVQPARKDEARAAIAQWLSLTSHLVFVRVNPQGTPWYAQDCALLDAPSVRGVMLPKSEDALAIEKMARSLRAGQELIPLIETVSGHFAAADIAGVRGVTRLAFGSFDFMADAGIESDEDLNPIRMGLVLESRRAGLPSPVDGVSLSIDDASRVQQDARRSRQLGFCAKLCIHPRQVAAVHSGLAPAPQDFEWARRVLAAMADGPLGAIAVDGKLVDKPVILKAEALLRELQRQSPSAIPSP